MTTIETRLTVEPLSGWTGALIHGADLSRPLSDGEIATIREALLRWKVVFFRDQDLDHASQIAFGKQFGDVTVSVRVERGQVSARVEADTPVVREWLQSNQQTLRHGLAEQNLTLDRLEVAAPPASRDAESRDSDRQRGGGDQPPSRRRPRQPQGQETFEVVA